LLSVKLRLVRFGRKKRPFYRIAAVDSRKKRDGAYIESIGHYNPLTHPTEILIDEEKALKWLDRGAEPSDTVRNLLSKKGILLKRSLMHRNVPVEQVEVEIQKWDLLQQEKRSKKKRVKEAAPAAPTEAVEEPAPVVETKPEEPMVEIKPEEPVEEVEEAVEPTPETVEPATEKEETPPSTDANESEEKS
jgi:small subunit ribosomal protein S16